MEKIYGMHKLVGLQLFWSRTPTFSCGTPTFCQMGVLNSCFQTPSESSETSTTKQETLPKGGGVAQFDFTKTFRNQLFSRVRVLYHQYSITKHSESILNSKIMSILMIIFVVVFSI